MSLREEAKTPPRLTRAEAKENTRVRVLQAAEAAFRRDGYHGASLERMAAEAGFTTGAIYSAFGSKADVMMALVAAQAERRRDEWARLVGAASSVEDFTEKVARQTAREGAAEREWWAVVIEFMTVVARDEGLRARYEEIHRESLSALGEAIRAWMQSGDGGWEIPPERLAILVNALGRGLGLEGLVAPAVVTEDLVVEAALTLLRGARAAGPQEVGG
jgi:AcrR family transcriptional regulator